MAATIDNPYKGPLPFTEQDRDFFFGRAREASGLVALVAANQLSLFFAPSGAGKSSLLHASLIPMLRATGRFVILPTARVGVGGDSRPVDSETNIYVHHLLSWLAPDSTAVADGILQPEIDPRRPSLSDALATHLAHSPAKGARDDAAHLLIIDQFEEILTTHPARWRQREDFFRQLAEAMFGHESLWVLLTLREEYVGALDRYAWMLPGKLRSRFYMRRLNQEAALAAIRNPAERLARPFAAGVAEQLVKDLSQMRLQEDARETITGEFVEPIQLQVVCQQLWENLKSQPPGPITAQDLALLGDVNQALAQFYDDAVASVVNDPTIAESELKVRQWFSSALITRAATRGTVFQEETTTGGLDNRAVARFEQLHLIRGEPRAGGKWYELVHDRFIEPIQAANRAWFDLHQSPISQAAQEWAADGRNPAKLYSESLLAEAQAQLDAQPDHFSELDKEFITSGLAAEQARRTRRLRAITTAVVTALAIMALLTFWALGAADEAIEAQATAEAANLDAETRRSEAQAEAERAALAGAMAEDARATTEASLFRARAESLAAQARNVHAQWPARALLLAIEALQEHEDADAHHPIVAEQSLRDLLGQTGGLPLLGHSDSVLAVAYSPQGDWLASAGADGTIRIWPADPLTTTAQTFVGHTWFVTSLAVSPDGERLASASVDGSVVLWNVANGEENARFELASPVNAVAFNQDGRLAAAADDGAIYLWEPANDATPEQWQANNSPALALAFSPDGTLLASASADQTIRIWGVATPGNPEIQLPTETGRINALAFHPAQHLLASAGDDGVVQVWNLDTQAVEQQFYHEQPVWALVFTPDGRGLVTGSDDSILRWWENFADPAARPRLLHGHEDAIRALAFDRVGGRLASGSGDRTVRVWEISSPVADPRILSGHAGSVNKAAFSHDGTLLASGDQAGELRLWRLDDLAAPQEPLDTQEQPIWSLAFSADDRYLANTDGDLVRLRAVDTPNEELPPLHADGDALNVVAFGEKGEWLAAAGMGGDIRLWQMANLAAEPQLLPRRHSAAIWSLAFAPNDDRVASAGDDGQILLWNLANLEAEPLALPGEGGSIWSVAFSPNGQWFADAGSDANIRLWQIGDLTQAPTVLSGHTQPVWHLSFSRDERWLASAGGDQTARLWDLMQPDATPIVLQGHTDPVNVVVFHPDGEWLASGSVDQTLRLWTLPMDRLVMLACRTAGRNLYAEEWVQSFPDKARIKTCIDLPLE